MTVGWDRWSYASYLEDFIGHGGKGTPPRYGFAVKYEGGGMRVIGHLPDRAAAKKFSRGQ